MRFFRFSLRTLMLLSLLAASAGTLWFYWPIWTPLAAPPQTDGEWWGTVRFLPDSAHYLVSTDRLRNLWLCDARTGKSTKHLEPEPRSPHEMIGRFSRSGRWIVAEAQTGAIPQDYAVFETATARQVGIVAVHGRVLFSSDDKRFAFPTFADDTYRVEVHDGQDGRLISTATRRYYADVALSPDGSIFLWGEQLLDATTGELIREFDSEEQGFHDVRISPDNRFFFSAAYKDGFALNRINIHDAATGKLLADFPGTLSKDPFALNNTLLVIQNSSKVELRKLEPPFELVRAFDGKLFEEGALSPDGKILMTYMDTKPFAISGSRPRGSNGGYREYAVTASDVATGAMLMSDKIPLSWPANEPMWHGRCICGPFYWDSARRDPISNSGFHAVSENGEFLSVSKSWEHSGAFLSNEVGISHHGESFGSISKWVDAISNDGLRAIVRGDSPGTAPARDNHAELWARRREPGIRGVLAMPAFWLTLILFVGVLWSIVRDRRELK